MCGESRAGGGAKIYRKLKVKREEPASQDVFERDYGDDGDLALWAYGKSTLTPPSPSKQKAKLNLSGLERERSSKARFNPPKTGMEIKLVNYLAKHWCACLFFLKRFCSWAGGRRKRKFIAACIAKTENLFFSRTQADQPKTIRRRREKGNLMTKKKLFLPLFHPPQKVIFSSFSRKSPSLASFVVSWDFLCVTT